MRPLAKWYARDQDGTKNILPIWRLQLYNPIKLNLLLARYVIYSKEVSMWLTQD